MLDTPEEIEEFFEHAGKKGMKWGVRKATDQKIRDARVLKESYRTKNNEIVTRLNYESSKNSNSAATKKAVKEYQDLVASAHKNGEQLKMADKLTSGEKISAGIVLGVGGALSVAALMGKI